LIVERRLAQVTVLQTTLDYQSAIVDLEAVQSAP